MGGSLPTQPPPQSGSLRTVAVTVLGVALALVPLALWIAWSTFVFTLVLVVCAASGALLVVLLGGERPLAGDRNDALGGHERQAVSDEFVAEVHRIFPLTHHHRRNGTARFRAAMKNLRRLID